MDIDIIKLSNLTTFPIKVYEEQVVDSQQVYAPFAWTETFLYDINNKSDSILLHIWPMKKTVILGMLDGRLPALTAGKNIIRDYGYEYFTRNIGGLAVVADEGILNFSLFIPSTSVEKIPIYDSYMLMVDLIKDAFSGYRQEIEHYEIAGSYCPGDYDMSINGKKFAGIAQRRVRNGIVISAYLSVCGDQQLRGQMLVDFYQQALQGEHVTAKYPTINPDSMANLSDLLEVSLSVADVADLIRLTLANIGFDMADLKPNEQEQKSFKHFYNKIERTQNKDV